MLCMEIFLQASNNPIGSCLAAASLHALSRSPTHHAQLLCYSKRLHNKPGRQKPAPQPPHKKADYSTNNSSSQALLHVPTCCVRPGHCWYCAWCGAAWPPAQRTAAKACPRDHTEHLGIARNAYLE